MHAAAAVLQRFMQWLPDYVQRPQKVLAAHLDAEVDLLLGNEWRTSAPRTSPRASSAVVISKMWPAASDGISVSTLAVDASSSGSSTSIESPTFSEPPCRGAL